jgi:Zn-dependent protease
LQPHFFARWPSCCLNIRHRLKLEKWFTIPHSMPPTIQFANPVKFDKLTRVLRVRGVDVYLHWTVFLIAGVMLYASFRRPWVVLAGGASWMALILLHECGHIIAAHRKHLRVLSIELYPIHGFCRFEMPWSRFDHCVIAWGGVMAQAVVAIPLLLWIEVFGYSRFDPIDAVLGILGPYSLLVAVFNLLPVGRLDGKIAWGIVPEFINRAKLRNNKKKKAAAGGWRSY